MKYKHTLHTHTLHQTWTHRHVTDLSTHTLRHIHTLARPVPVVSVNDRLWIQNKFLPCKEPVSTPEMLPRMALTVYTATTTITTLLP